MIRVLVVDDSAVVRRVLSEELAKTGDIEVVGTAIDPYAARQKILELEPDVITLDIEMPRMDGLSFLAKIMQHHPLPVIIVSSLAPENSETAMAAMRLGAVEVIPKPSTQFSVPDVRRHLARAIRAAASAKLLNDLPKPTAARVQVGLEAVHTTHRLIAIGASTGGTRALEHVLVGMPPDAPGIVIVQHMPAGFTRSFAERLDHACAITVREARDREPIAPGLCLIAPGDHHLMVKRSGAQMLAVIKNGPPVNHHRPSVDVLFESVARDVGKNAVGCILTGMGADGARGMRAMRQAGAYTIAQDEATSTVYGMPKAALDLGGVLEVTALPDIAQSLLDATAMNRQSVAQPKTA